MIRIVFFLSLVSGCGVINAAQNIDNVDCILGLELLVEVQEAEEDANDCPDLDINEIDSCNDDIDCDDFWKCADRESQQGCAFDIVLVCASEGVGSADCATDSITVDPAVQ